MRGAYDQAHLPGGPLIPYSAPLAKYRDDLHSAFPSEAAGIDRYFKLLHDGASAARSSFVARGLMSLNGRPMSNVSRDLALALTTDVLDSVTHDPYLQLRARHALGVSTARLRRTRSPSASTHCSIGTTARARTTRWAAR